MDYQKQVTAIQLGDYKGFKYDLVDSTMDRAKVLIRSKDLQNERVFFVQANAQELGRGTHGRKWISPEGNIYLSIVHQSSDHELFALSTSYTLAAGIACVEALREICEIEAKLKPINDIYVNACKLGGILTESLLAGESIKHIVTGIGINLRRIETLELAFSVNPVSIQELMSVEDFLHLSSEKLILRIIERLDYYYQNYVFKGLEIEIKEIWGKECLAG